MVEIEVELVSLLKSWIVSPCFAFRLRASEELIYPAQTALSPYTQGKLRVRHNDCDPRTESG